MNEPGSHLIYSSIHDNIIRQFKLQDKDREGQKKGYQLVGHNWHGDTYITSDNFSAQKNIFPNSVTLHSFQREHQKSHDSSMLV